MKPTEVLTNEHVAILQMPEVLGKSCGKLESKETLDPDHLEQHHRKLGELKKLYL